MYFNFIVSSFSFSLPPLFIFFLFSSYSSSSTFLFSVDFLSFLFSFSSSSFTTSLYSVSHFQKLILDTNNESRQQIIIIFKRAHKVRFPPANSEAHFIIQLVFVEICNLCKILRIYLNHPISLLFIVQSSDYLSTLFELYCFLPYPSCSCSPELQLKNFGLELSIKVS